MSTRIPSADPVAPRAPRARRAVVEVEQADPLAELKVMAQTIFSSNKDMNAAKRTHDKTREQLADAMRKQGVAQFEAPGMDGKNEVILDSVLATPDREVVDVEELSKLVSLADLLKMVSATKESVSKFAGAHVLAKVIKVVPGNENVTVKARK